MVRLIASLAIAIAFGTLAFAGGHDDVAKSMATEIHSGVNVGPGNSAGSNASLLKGGWGNRNDTLTGTPVFGPAQVTGKPAKAQLK